MVAFFLQIKGIKVGWATTTRVSVDHSHISKKGEMVEEKKSMALGQTETRTDECSQDQSYDIDLMELFNTVCRWKKFIIGFILVCTLTAVIISVFILPVMYKSSAVLQPSENMTKKAQLLAAFSSALPISISDGGEKTQTIVNYLNSRTMQAWMINEFNLLAMLYPDKWDQEKKQWKNASSDSHPSVTMALQRRRLAKLFSVDYDKKTGLISISYLDKDPLFAKKVVAGVITELERYLLHDNVTDAKRNRLFVEEQVARTTQELEYWEKQVPSANLTESTVLREQRALLVVYTELKKQFELAKIEEAKQVVAFKVLDEPLVPELKDKPNRRLICLGTLMFSGLFAIMLVFVFEFIKSVMPRKQ